jgi:Fibronectin type III domain/Domain of unknown function (DUF5122) beta-propeller
MENRFTARYIVIAALFLTILTPVTGAHASGELNTTFGNIGYLIVDDVPEDGATYEKINDTASQAEKIIIVGEKGGSLFVARLNSSGQLDSTFGGNDTGFMTLDQYREAYRVITLDSGDFFVLASKTQAGKEISALIKFNANGTVSNSFNTVTFDFIFNGLFDNFYAADLAKSPDGASIYVALNSFLSNSNNSYYDILLYKFSLAGSNDSVFFTNYRGDPNVGYPTGWVNSIVVSSDDIYIAGYKDTTVNYVTYQIGQVIKINSNGSRDNNFPSPNANFSPAFTTINPYGTGQYNVQIADIKLGSSGDLYIAGVAYAPYINGAYEESEFFVKKISSGGSEVASQIFFTPNISSYGYNPSLALYGDDKVLILIPSARYENSSYIEFARIFRLTSSLSSDNFGVGGRITLSDTYSMRSIILDSNQRIISAGGFGDLSNNGYAVSGHFSFDPPGSPTIGTATTASATSATVTFTAPASNGGSAITSYTATSSPSGLTGTLAGATAGTITISGLTASTAYTFTVTATNLEGTSGASSASNSITTSAIAPGSGGSGPVSTAAAEKQRKDKELTETLALVPVIAGLAQELAGLGDSILKPKKCVKGKSVKKVSSTAKCPKGFKVKR